MSLALSVGKINSKALEFEWKINFDYDFINKSYDDKISSPTFHIQSFGKETKWCLSMYPKGRSDEKKYSIIFVKNLSGFGVEATCCASLTNGENQKLKQWSRKHLFGPRDGWGNLQFVEQSFLVDPLNNLLDNGEITILCQITIHSVFDPVVCKNFLRVKELDDFEKILLNEKFSDLTITTADGKSIHAHKAILACRSPVFEAMFEHEMIEKKLSVIDIEDVEHEVLFEVLRFVYTGKVDKIETMLFELLRVAEKYCIEGLKSKCEEILLISLTTKNALKYLVEADKNNCKLNVKLISEFIVRHSKDLVSTSEFQSLCLSHSHLLYDIINQIVYGKKTE